MKKLSDLRNGHKWEFSKDGNEDRWNGFRALGTGKWPPLRFRWLPEYGNAQVPRRGSLQMRSASHAGVREWSCRAAAATLPMEVLFLTTLFSVLFAIFFLALFLRSRQGGGSCSDQDALLPFRDEPAAQTVAPAKPNRFLKDHDE